LTNGISGDSIEGEYLTHNLYDIKNDDIVKRLISKDLFNKTGHKVQVIFVPSYLNGADGVINKTYYELLIGFDLSAFPSYYEPWGYTPLESIAFHVPTVTTNLAGFGLWMKEYAKSQENGVLVLDRSETNAASVTSGIAYFIKNYSLSNTTLRNSMRQSAFRLSRLALWENLIDFYKKTYGNSPVSFFEGEEGTLWAFAVSFGEKTKNFVVSLPGETKRHGEMPIRGDKKDTDEMPIVKR